MRNIQPYTGRALDLYDAILESKRDGSGRHGLLESLRRRIIEKYYASYEASKAHLETFQRDAALPGLTRQEREALFHCYDSETKPLAQMKRDVLAALPREMNKCPYCGIGEIGHANGQMGGWDHYLPRRNSSSPGDAFAELSVHPTNLVPCCAECNGHKGERWRDGTQRRFINFYYDAIDQSVPLLEASIEIPADGELRVTYDFVHRPHEPFFSLYKRHCRNLKLLERYRSDAEKKLSLIRDEIRRLLKYGVSEQHLPDLWRELAADLAARLGINHWEPTLYRAAAASGELLHHCLGGSGAVRESGAEPSGGQPT